MARLLELIVKAMLWIAMACGGAMGIFVSVSAGSRYLFNHPIHFTEELVGIAFGSIFFFSLPYCSFTARHISADLFANSTSPTVRRVLKRLGNGVMVAFLFWLGWVAIDFLQTSILFGSRSDVLNLYLPYFMASFPVSMFFAAFIHLMIAVGVLEQSEPAEASIPSH